MDAKALRGLLALCAAIAMIPFVPWLIALTFNSVDERWLDSLGGLSVSVPFALGLAALVLAGHGLLLHQELADGLEEGLATLLDRDPLSNGLASSVSRGFTPAPSSASINLAPGGSSVAESEDSGGSAPDLGSADEKIPTVGKEPKGGKAMAKSKTKADLAKSRFKRNVQIRINSLRR